MNHNHKSSQNHIPFIIITFLFFIFGFVTWANGTLIPFFKLSFQLSNTKAFFVTFASYIAYFFLALPSSWILKQLGFKNGIVLGLTILGLGSLLFIPAAYYKSFTLFLTAIFIQGASLSLLQTAANPYLTIIGPAESAAKRISIAGIFNKFAGIIVPIIMGSVFLKNASLIENKIKKSTGIEKEQLLTEVLSRVNTPYIILAVIFLLFAIVVNYAYLPEIKLNNHTIANTKETPSKKTSIFQFPYLFLGALCIFMYVAAEVMAGDIISIYGKSLGIHPDKAKYLTSITLLSMLLGYVIGIFAIPKYISQSLALRISALLGILFCTIAFLNVQHQFSIFFIALLGLSNALMWPAIFPLGIYNLGKFTKTGSAIMIMGIAGGALWPLLYGFLSDSPSHGGLGIPFHTSFYIAILPCYLYILFYATKGYKIGLKQ